MIATERLYTPDQVLEILYDSTLGSSFYKSPTDGFPDMSLLEFDEWIEPFKSTKSQFLACFERMAQWFGIEFSKEEWLPLAKGKTTMRELAEFIAARAPYREIRPIRILGRPCLEAGIFRELQSATKEIAGREVHVGPSSHVNEVLNKSQRERLASRVHVLFRCPDGCSQLWYSSPVSRATGYCFFAMVVSTISGFIAVSLGGAGTVREILGLIGGFLSAGACALIPMFCLLGIAGWLCNWGNGPFCSEIRTYRDLVDVLKNIPLRIEPTTAGAVCPAKA